MSRTYGRLQGNRGMATRCGTDRIFTSAETWKGSVHVYLDADGSFTINIGPKHGVQDGLGGTIILVGNVGDDGRNCYLRKSAFDKIAKPIPVQCIKRSRRVTV